MRHNNYTMKRTNTIISLLSAIIVLTVSLLTAACTSNSKTDVKPEEDNDAKAKLQGTWISETDGDVMFTIKGDTLFYNDSLSAPVAFCVRHDSLIIRNHNEVRYPIIRLNSTQFYFINADGDEVDLIKGENAPALEKGEYKGAIDLNQGRKIKRDSVVTYNGKRYHAYTQVNPTSYKVYHQSTNNDGMTVETVFYDNIVFIALYDGVNKVFGQNIHKKDLSGVVPAAYLEKAVLSDILIQGDSKDGVRFVAILSVPDTYTNYRVNIDITPSGKKIISI